MVLPLLSGVLHYISFFPGFWPLSFVALIPILLFLREVSSTRRVFLGWLVYALVFYPLSALYIFEPLFILSGVVLSLIAPTLVSMGVKFRGSSLFMVWCATSIVLSEYLIARFALFPSFIAMAGNVLADSPFIGLSRYGGVVFLSVIVLAVNVLVSLAYVSVRKRNGMAERVKSSLVYASAGVFFLLALGTVSAFAPVHQLPGGEKILRVAVVSTGDTFDDRSSELDSLANADEHVWMRSVRSYIQDRVSEVESALIPEDPDIVFLPEDMLDFELRGIPDLRAESALGVTNAGPLLSEYSDLARRLNSAVVATLTIFDPSGEKYNSSILIGKDGEFLSVYNKYLLTNFSETWPFGSWIPPYWRWYARDLGLEKRAEAFAGWFPAHRYARAGDPYVPLEWNGTRFGTAICSEGQFPIALGSFKDSGAAFIAHISSNTWVPNFRAQYLALVDNLRRIEAVEFSVPIFISGKGESPGVTLPDGTLISGALTGGRVGILIQTIPISAR